MLEVFQDDDSHLHSPPLPTIVKSISIYIRHASLRGEGEMRVEGESRAPLRQGGGGEMRAEGENGFSWKIVIYILK